MRRVRFLWYGWRWLLWPAVAATVVVVLVSIPPPAAPDCPSILDVARWERPRPAGYYSCRTGPTGDWVVPVLLIGLSVLVGGLVLEATVKRVHRSAVGVRHRHPSG